MGRVLRSLALRFSSLTAVFDSPDLRNLQLAWAGFFVCEWTSFVGLSIYAYRTGGAAAVGVLGLVRMLPATLGVLTGSALADRTQRERVLLGVHLIRAAALGGAALVLAAGGPAAPVFALAACASVAGAAYRPSHLAVVPILARTARELVATNVSASAFEGVAVLVGPALAGVLLTFSSVEVVLALSAGIAVLAAVGIVKLSPSPHLPAAGRGAVDDLLVGVRTLAEEPGPRLVIGLFGSQAFVRGILNVLLVVAALSLLGAGDEGVGFLNAAFGAGGLAGGLAGLGLVGLRRLARPFAGGLVLWGVPLALVAAWPHEVWALACLALVGAGNAVLDVSGFTIIQRGIDDAVLARVFGVLEIVAVIGVGVGSVVGSLLVDEVGARSGLVAAGGLLVALAAVTYPRLKRLDGSAGVPERELGIVSSVPLFSPLPVTTLERLAAHLLPATAAANTEILREGDEGDLFYVIVSGTVEVRQAGHRVATLGPNEYFGEIALLREVPRVASCRAETDVELYTLERARFVSAVSGHTSSAVEAESVTSRRLAELDALAET